jgi:glycosyltransferase involved in cell wall biosynthesis
MDVSVVIPTRDRPELLALTLRSVLWQEAVHAEILVVDDGVGQGTDTLLRQVADRRVRLLRNAGPPGVSGARNSGIAAATGDWISFLDDDDLWAPSKLAAQLTVADRTGAGWVYAGDVTCDQDLRVRSGAPPPSPEQVVSELRRHNAVPAGASNVMVRREVVDTVGRFDSQLRTSEDWDLWLRLAATGLPACVPRPLVALRMHGGMASRAVDRMLADIEIIAHRHRIPVDRPRHQRWAAWMCLEDGRRSVALRHYARAVMAGDLASVGRAAVALLDPEVGRKRPLPTDDWTREAQTWLNALRPDSTHSGGNASKRPESK